MIRTVAAISICLTTSCLAGPGMSLSAIARSSAGGPVQVFPHVWVDARSKVVEIDGFVPVDAHDPEAPDVYLEVVVCARDSKEHESLVVTDAKPSHIHAALLLAGLEPGWPGTIAWHPEKVDYIWPSGDPVEISFHWTDDAGVEHAADPREWIVQEGARRPIARVLPDARWVFAGSRIVQWQGGDFYDADGTGLIVGLATFGGEPIAFTEVFSPHAALQEPEWLASPSTPKFGTPVRVRFKRQS